MSTAFAFDSLYALHQHADQSFLDWLRVSGNLEGYLQRLVQAFNPARRARCDVPQHAVGGMGRGGSTIATSIKCSRGVREAPQHISEFDFQALARREIRVARHCYGCTAGRGSAPAEPPRDGTLGSAASGGVCLRKSAARWRRKNTPRGGGRPSAGGALRGGLSSKTPAQPSAPCPSASCSRPPKRNRRARSTRRRGFKVTGSSASGSSAC